MQQKRQKIKKTINKERLEFEKLLEIGRLVKNDKKRVTALIYCDANGGIPNRPAIIDYNFPTNCKSLIWIRKVNMRATMISRSLLRKLN